ncbi:MAG TPA: hypothetical protein VGR39_06795 [Candidatus Acidoferrales bacterium]|nr:hypothetical protein [Candidatus Acidoferrales bacterium]
MKVSPMQNVNRLPRLKRFPRLKQLPLSATERRLATSKIVGAIPLDSDGAGAVGQINRYNVGRIAERIIANELEARGFRVSDLNKEGTAANADLVAISPSQTLQIQVKGSTNGPKDRRWWVGYGYFSETIVTGRKPIFNRAKSFYTANVVILVAVRSPKEYSCVVLPVDIAKRAAQKHLDAFRARGWPRGRTNMKLEPPPRAKEHPKVIQERAMLANYRDEKGWAHLLSRVKATAK